MALAGARAGAEIMDKGGAGAENKLFWLCNTEFVVGKIPYLIYLFYCKV